MCAWWQSPRRSGSRISNASGKERPVLCCLLVQSTVRTRYRQVGNILESQIPYIYLYVHR